MWARRLNPEGVHEVARDFAPGGPWAFVQAGQSFPTEPGKNIRRLHAGWSSGAGGLPAPVRGLPGK